MLQIDLSKIKKIREAKKISIQRMSELLGYKTYFGYYRLENGQRKIKAWQLPIIAKELGEKIEDLFFESKSSKMEQKEVNQ